MPGSDNGNNRDPRSQMLDVPDPVNRDPMKEAAAVKMGAISPNVLAAMVINPLDLYLLRHRGPKKREFDRDHFDGRLEVFQNIGPEMKRPLNG